MTWLVSIFPSVQNLPSEHCGRVWPVGLVAFDFLGVPLGDADRYHPVCVFYCCTGLKTHVHFPLSFLCPIWSVHGRTNPSNHMSRSSVVCKNCHVKACVLARDFAAKSRKRKRERTAKKPMLESGRTVCSPTADLR